MRIDQPTNQPATTTTTTKGSERVGRRERRKREEEKKAQNALSTPDPETKRQTIQQSNKKTPPVSCKTGHINRIYIQAKRPQKNAKRFFRSSLSLQEKRSLWNKGGEEKAKTMTQTATKRKKSAGCKKKRVCSQKKRFRDEWTERWPGDFEYAG